METRRLAEGLAEEIRDPLHIIRGAAEIRAVVSAREGNSEAWSTYAEIMEEVDRIDRLLMDLLIYATPLEPRREADTELASLLRSVSGPIEDRTGASITVRVAATQAVRLVGRGVAVDDGQLPSVAVGSEHARTLLYHLLRFAARSAGEDGQVWVESWRRRDRVILRVVHDGRAIDDAQLPGLLEPFGCRGSKVGFDLAIVRRVAQLYDGRLVVRAGATDLRLRLPAAAR